MLILALIQPYYDNPCVSWNNGAAVHLKHRLQTSQNRLVMLIFDLCTRIHLESSHFERLGWLKVEDCVSQIQLCMVHRIVYGDVPKYFRNYFDRVSEVHRHSTRGNSTHFVPPRVQTNLGKDYFLYAGKTLWNRLPGRLKSVRNIGSFKKALKQWLRRQF